VSSINNGLRRAGIVGLSTLVATSMLTLSAATTYAAAGDYAALSVAAVLPDTTPQHPQAAGDLTLEFANTWATGATQTFTVGSNNCATTAGISAAVGFADVPARAVTDPGTANSVTDTTPVFAAGVLSSSTPACAAVNIQDKVTYTVGAVSSGVLTDTWVLKLTSVDYLVGATTPTGNINVATAGAFKAAGSVANAVIAGSAFTNTAKVLALPAATGVTLGTQTVVENSVGAFFSGTASTPTVVTLKLSGTSKFTNGVTPTVTLPTGYTKTVVATAGSAGTYSFTVTSPAVPVAATMTVSGLTIVAGDATDATLTISATNGATPPTVVALPAVVVVRIVDFSQRTGGSDRYATAAALFTTEFAKTDVVLSSGANFPDALSANYLAGQLGTGIMLTMPNTLPSVVRQALFTEGISTVYITGGTGAVSKAVQDQIEAMHVGNVPTAALITVVRLGGTDRYDTNQIINKRTFVARNTVMLATGKNFADALAVGPIAHRLHFPLILTNGTALGASQKAQLSDFNPTNVVIAGGTGVVSQAIEDSLKTQGFKVVRLAGSDRTLTAARVAEWATTGVVSATGFAHVSLGFNSTTAHITTGNNFADALAAGPVAGSKDCVIMPTNSATSLGAGIPLYFGTKTVGAATPDGISVLHALGLTGAVSNAVMTEAALAIG